MNDLKELLIEVGIRLLGFIGQIAILALGVYLILEVLKTVENGL